MNQESIIFTVMLASGILGGLMNYFISENSNSSKIPWWQHIILGVGASFMVPLFLNMISSGLISDIIGNEAGKPGDSAKIFVLAGFSLVAAVSSRAFIRTLSERILQEVKEAKSEAQEAKSQATTALNVLDENESQERSTPSETVNSIDDHQLMEEEKKIISIMSTGRYSLRSISGLATDTGIEKGIVNAAISSLMEKGLIEQGMNSRDQVRWYLSPTGRIAANRVNKSS